MFKKLVCCAVVVACLMLPTVNSFGQTKSAPLAKYLYPVEWDTLDVILLEVQMLYQNVITRAKMDVLAEAVNQALEKTSMIKTGKIELQKLDIFNYSLSFIGYDDSTNKIRMHFLISDNITNMRTTEGLKQFMASCFAPLTGAISKFVPEFDEKRDLYIEFSSMEKPEKTIAKYQDGIYMF